MAMFTDLFVEHIANDGLIVMTSHHDIPLEDSRIRLLDLGEAA